MLDPRLPLDQDKVTAPVEPGRTSLKGSRVRRAETVAQMRSLVDKVRVVESSEERARQIRELVRDPAKGNVPRILSFLNQHGFNLAYVDAQVRESLAASDVLLRDGVGLEAAMRVLDRPVGINCNGTDLIPDLLRAARGRSIAVFGTRDPWLSAATEVIAGFGVTVLVMRDGFWDDDTYLCDVRENRPEIVLLGMGMPRQEILAVRIRQSAACGCLIVNGGAILDFLGGRYPRAPLWMQRLRVEWLFRLAHEPKRLFGRYVFGAGTFALRVLAVQQGGRRHG